MLTATVLHERSSTLLVRAEQQQQTHTNPNISISLPMSSICPTLLLSHAIVDLHEHSCDDTSVSSTLGTL